MNSRDAAYDEDMILARVLEESKTEVKVPTTGRQRRKRPGSESPDECVDPEYPIDAFVADMAHSSKDNKRRRTSESEESGQQGGSSGSGDEASNSGAAARKSRNNSIKNADKSSTKRSSRNNTKGEKTKDSRKEGEFE